MQKLITHLQQDGFRMKYYDDNAEEYVQKTMPLDMGDLYSKFLRCIPQNGFILDAGCGSGRDSLYFLQQGYNVEAFDASRELSKLAAELTSLPVQCLTFQEMIPCSRFDGIWANATLLHVPHAELQGVLETLKLALKPGGTLYCSFKYGDTDSTDQLGRDFTNQTCVSLEKELAKAGFSGRRTIFTRTSTTPEGGTQEWVIGIASIPT